MSKLWLAALLEAELLRVTATSITFSVTPSTPLVSVTESKVILEKPLFPPDFIARKPEKVTSVVCPGSTLTPEA